MNNRKLKKNNEDLPLWVVMTLIVLSLPLLALWNPGEEMYVYDSKACEFEAAEAGAKKWEFDDQTKKCRYKR